MIPQYYFSRIDNWGNFNSLGTGFDKLKFVESKSKNPSPKWGLIPPQKICPISDIPFLHIDVTVPYETEISQEAIDSELQLILADSYRELESYRWSEYFRENTSQGTKHRILISYWQKEIKTPTWPNVFPWEIILVQLANRILELKNLSHLWLLFQKGEDIYSMLMLSNAPFHLLKLNSGSLKLKERLSRHYKYGKNNIADKSKIPVLFVGEENEDRTKISEYVNGIAEPILSLDFDLKKELHYALVSCNREGIRPHNIVDSAQKEILDGKEYKPVLRNSIIYALLACGLLTLWPIYSQISQEKKLAKLNEIGEAFKTRLSQIEAISKENKKKARLLDTYSGIAMESFPTSHFFKQLGLSLPLDGEISGIILKKKENFKMEFHFEAEVKDWNSVADFKALLEKSPWVMDVSISDQKKIEKRNRVQFNARGTLKGYLL